VVPYTALTGDQVQPANLVAHSIGTVTSDLLCAVSARVPRMYSLLEALARRVLHSVKTMCRSSHLALTPAFRSVYTPPERN
jgi:hypothetical protein